MFLVILSSVPDVAKIYLLTSEVDIVGWDYPMSHDTTGYYTMQ